MITKFMVSCSKYSQVSGASNSLKVILAMIQGPEEVNISMSWVHATLRDASSRASILMLVGKAWAEKGLEKGALLQLHAAEA